MMIAILRPSMDEKSIIIFVTSGHHIEEITVEKENNKRAKPGRCA
jgi:hypothetical protein